jgi:hypothetical protein
MNTLGYLKIIDSTTREPFHSISLRPFEPAYCLVKIVINLHNWPRRPKPIHLAVAFAAQVGKIGPPKRLIVSLIAKLEETPNAGPDLHTRAVAYIDEVAQYTRVQQLDNTFWGRTSYFRVKGGLYIRKNKRPIDAVADHNIIDMVSLRSTLTSSGDCLPTVRPSPSAAHNTVFGRKLNTGCGRSHSQQPLKPWPMKDRKMMVAL